MRALGWIAVGLVVGFALGGIAPRRALEERERELASRHGVEDDQDPEQRDRATLPGLDRILRPAPRQEEPIAGDGARGDEGTEGTEVAAPERSRAADGDAGVRPSRARVRDEFHVAAEAQTIRIAQTRAALIEQAELDAAGQAELDRVVAEMNAALYGYGEEIAMLAVTETEPAPRDMLGIAHDVTGVLHDGQLALERLLGERAASVEPSAVEIWNFVDLVPLEGAVDAALDGER